MTALAGLIRKEVYHILRDRRTQRLDSERVHEVILPPWPQPDRSSGTLDC